MKRSSEDLRVGWDRGPCLPDAEVLSLSSTSKCDVLESGSPRRVEAACPSAAGGALRTMACDIPLAMEVAVPSMLDIMVDPLTLRVLSEVASGGLVESGPAEDGVSEGQSCSLPPTEMVRGFSLASSKDRLPLDGLIVLVKEATGRDGRGFSAGRGLSMVVKPGF